MLTAILFALADGPSASPPPPAPATGQYARPRSAGGPHVCPETQYPVPALQTGTEGKTILQFTITTEGKVSDVYVNSSSGNGDLDTASTNCARDWLYRPATRGGYGGQLAMAGGSGLEDRRDANLRRFGSRELAVRQSGQRCL